MTASELRISLGVITTEYAIFVVLLVTALGDMLKPLTPVVMLGVIYVRTWIVNIPKNELSQRMERVQRALLGLAIFILALALFCPSSELEAFAPEKSARVALGVVTLAVIWAWDCVGAWRHYDFSRP